jgi:hypothetical protein
MLITTRRCPPTSLLSREVSKQEKRRRPAENARRSRSRVVAAYKLHGDLGQQLPVAMR